MITIKRNSDITDRLVFEMREEDALLGTVSASLSDDGDLVINGLESEKEIYYDGLCRAILAYASMRGVNRAIFTTTDERVKRRLTGFGFITENSCVLEDINAFFENDNCDK